MFEKVLYHWHIPALATAEPFCYPSIRLFFSLSTRLRLTFTTTTRWSAVPWTLGRWWPRWTVASTPRQTHSLSTSDSFLQTATSTTHQVTTWSPWQRNWKRWGLLHVFISYRFQCHNSFWWLLIRWRELNFTITKFNRNDIVSGFRGSLQVFAWRGRVLRSPSDGCLSQPAQEGRPTSQEGRAL